MLIAEQFLLVMFYAFLLTLQVCFQYFQIVLCLLIFVVLLSVLVCFLALNFFIFL